MKRYVLAAACGLMILSFAGPARAQGPVPGQPYQIPDGYAGYVADPTIAYGGFNYVIQADGTMLLANQPASTAATGGTAAAGDADGDVDADDRGSAQAYQIPTGTPATPPVRQSRTAPRTM